MFLSCFGFTGENLVSKSPIEVQEVVEKWRNSPGATCGLQWVSSLPFSARLRGMGLSTQSKNEQCKLGSAAKQQSSEHDCAFLLGELFLVLINELGHTSSAQRISTAPSQLSNECRDNILTNDFLTWRITPTFRFLSDCSPVDVMTAQVWPSLFSVPVSLHNTLFSLTRNYKLAGATEAV